MTDSRQVTAQDVADLALGDGYRDGEIERIAARVENAERLLTLMLGFLTPEQLLAIVVRINGRAVVRPYGSYEQHLTA